MSGALAQHHRLHGVQPVLPVPDLLVAIAWDHHAPDRLRAADGTPVEVFEISQLAEAQNLFAGFTPVR